MGISNLEKRVRAQFVVEYDEGVWCVIDNAQRSFHNEYLQHDFHVLCDFATQQQAERERNKYVRHLLARTKSQTAPDGRKCVAWSDALSAVHPAQLRTLMGLRVWPMRVGDIKKGDYVAAVSTWFGMRASNVRLLPVSAVKREGVFGVVVSFASDDADSENDDDELVWVRPYEN